MANDQTAELSSANKRLEASEMQLRAANQQLEANYQQLKASEQTLRESEERFRAIAENLTEALTITDSSGTILYCNNAAAKMFGYTREDLQGKDSSIFIPLKNNESHYKNKETLIATGNYSTAGSTIESVAVRKDGTEFPIDFSFSYWDINNEVFFAALTRDITERKQAEDNLRAAHEIVRAREEELKATNERLMAREEQLLAANKELMESQKILARLAAAVEQASEGVAITDLDGKFVYVNPAYEQITGYTGKEIIGRAIYMFNTAEQDSAILKKQSETIAGGKPWKGHIKLKIKDEKKIDVDIIVSPIKDMSGKNISYVAVIRDITMELQIEKQLQHTQKMETIGTLAGGIAHDFNNILSAIIGYADMSLVKIPEGAFAHNYLQQILKACSRAEELVKQILMFSRKKAEERRPVQLNSVVSDALKFLRASIPTTIEICHATKDFTGVIVADPVQIHQVIMNLCTNAAHAMNEAGGVLSVDLSTLTVDMQNISQYPDISSGEYFKLTVSDTGTGIDPEIMDRIFEPFFTTKEAGKGTGIGLAVVHAIVKNHGGTVRVYSAPGEGASFNILLPKANEPMAEINEAPRPVPSGNESILFVDDDETLIVLEEKILTHLGYRVVPAPGSIEALETFKKNPEAFDLVITDQTMPHMTGYDLAKRILEIRPDMPIILCTGYHEKVTEEKTREQGIKALVMKPISMREIAEAIRRVLDIKTV